MAGNVRYVGEGGAVLAEGRGFVTVFGGRVGEDASSTAFDVALHVEVLVLRGVLVPAGRAARQVNTLSDFAPLPIMTMLGRFYWDAALTVFPGCAATTPAGALARIVTTAAK